MEPDDITAAWQRRRSPRPSPTSGLQSNLTDLSMPLSSPSPRRLREPAQEPSPRLGGHAAFDTRNTRMRVCPQLNVDLGPPRMATYSIQPSRNVRAAPFGGRTATRSADEHQTRSIEEPSEVTRRSMASHAAESPNGMQPGIQDGLVALNDNEKTMQDQLQELSRQQESLMQALEKADETDRLWQAEKQRLQNELEAAAVEARRKTAAPQVDDQLQNKLMDLAPKAEKQAQTSEKSEQAPQAEKEQLKKQLEDREQEANHELRENKLMELEQKAEEKAKLASTLQDKFDALTMHNEQMQQELRQAEKKEQVTEKSEQALQAEKEQLKKQLEDKEQEAKGKEAALQANHELQENKLMELEQKAEEKAKLASTLQDQFDALTMHHEQMQQELRQAEKKEQVTEKSEQALQAEKEQLKKQLEDKEQEAKGKEAALQANHELQENKLMELEQKAAEKMKLASTLEVKLEKLQQELRQAEKKEQATEKTEHALQAEKEQLKKQLEDREQEAKTKEAASQAQLELLKNELREAQQAQQKARLRDAEKEATDEACARRAEEHTRKVQESEEALTKRADVAENTRESHEVNFDFAQMELPAEKQKWLTEVKRNGQNLQKAPEHLKNDKDVVLAAVEEHRLALQHASEELKKNKDVVTAAVEKDPRAFTFASEELKKDISFVKTVVQLKPKALEFAADALKQNKDVVLVAVQHSGSALQHAAEALQSDQEVVMAAVQQNGEALQYAAAAFKAEKEVVMAAVQQNGEALQYAAAAFSAEKEVVMAAVQQNGKALQFAAATLKTDKELVQAAWLQRVLRDGTEMQHAPWILRNNREFLIKAVAATRAPWLLKLSSEALKQDKELSEHLKALAGTGLVFTYYHSFDCFHNMREAFLATGASAPGGQAYEEVMKKLNETSGGSATVWFDKVHVWGFAAGHWRHPSTDCGRDMVPVPPPEGRDPMWEAMVESRIERLTPEVGSQHPCWCCRWLRVVKEKIEAGAVICCVVSNIYDDSWVDDYGAGSSEVSDRVAEHYGLKRERFRNGRPAGWGEGSIEIYEGRGRTHKYSRVAPMHPHTKLPLGEGCRWEREALDNLDCTVMAFFMP